MPSKSIKSACSVNCPKVKEQLRYEIEKEPSLLEGIFPRKKDDTSTGLSEDFVSKDVRNEATASLIVVENLNDRKFIQESKVVQEERTVSVENKTNHNDYKVNSIEENSVVKKLLLVVESEEVSDDVDETTDFVSDKRAKGNEEERIADHAKSIDKESRETLPTAITNEKAKVRLQEVSKDIPTSNNKMHRENRTKLATERKMMSTIPEEHRIITSAHEIPTTSFNSIVTSGKSVDSEDEGKSLKRSRMDMENEFCDETCPLMSKQREHITRKSEERQRIVDHYYLTKGFSYFEDICTCSLACILHTLSRDRFVRSIVASFAIFALGMKLCCELDAWEMPKRVS